MTHVTGMWDVFKHGEVLESHFLKSSSLHYLIQSVQFRVVKVTVHTA